MSSFFIWLKSFIADEAICMTTKNFNVIIERNVPCKLRDGTILYSDIYRPSQEGRFPVVMTRTPYNKENLTLGIGVQVHPVHAACRGYVAIVQDVRGRFSSQGKFNAFADETNDGVDTLKWAASLPYSDGKIGMFGGSFTGINQIEAAIGKTPWLVAISPRHTGSNYYQGWCYQSGAFLLGFNILWSINVGVGEVGRQPLNVDDKKRIVGELADACDHLVATSTTLPLDRIEIFRKYGISPFFYDWMTHPSYDEFWKGIDVEKHYKDIDVAGFHIGGWFDIFLGGTIQNYLGLKNRRQKLIIGPWVHATDMTNLVGDWDFGYLAQGSAIGIEEMQFRWFDFWLKGTQNGVTDEPPVMFFVMGENKWRTENEWPIARTVYTKYYLRSNGKANTLRGDGALSLEAPGKESQDTYTYDPMKPVLTRGGATTGSLMGALPSGVFDQTPTEQRDDVLVYTTEALSKDVEVTGPVRLVLWASSSQEDTDFTAKLVDVELNGYARILCDGILRARYRESFEKPKLVEPGEAYEFHIDLAATSNLFKKGHRIRLEISSSNFPKFDRNLNTGKHFASDSDPRAAIQTIYHDFEHPSHVILPIIPRPN